MNQRLAGRLNSVAAVLEIHLVAPVLQEEVELSEDLGDVAPVDLVDDENEGGIRDWPRPPRRSNAAGPALSLKPAWPPGVSVGRKPFDEVLVGVGWVELDDLEVAAVLSTVLGDALGDVGLAGAGRALEDRLPLVLQAGDDLLQMFGVPEEALGQGVNVCRRPWVRSVAARIAILQ